jgi:hypothetical protein
MAGSRASAQSDPHLGKPSLFDAARCVCYDAVASDQPFRDLKPILGQNGRELHNIPDAENFKRWKFQTLEIPNLENQIVGICAFPINIDVNDFFA